MQTKECIKCHSILPASKDFFFAQKRNPDGFRSDCKKCFYGEYFPDWKPTIRIPKTPQQRNKETSLRRKIDPIAKITHLARVRLNLALKGGFYKSCKTLDLLGCSPEDLKKYLESKFRDGMTWDNHGRYGWHIDHIRPCASFDLSDPEQQHICFHYTNLQPLWWHENLSKPKFKV